jgi:hypothetical protein
MLRWCCAIGLARSARSVPVSSGSKGLHVYVPMDDPITATGIGVGPAGRRGT